MSYKYNKNSIAVTIVAILVIVLFTTLPLFSATTNSGNVKLIVSTIPELKVEAGYNVSFPFLQGDSMLTSGNNVKIKTLLGVSPIAATLQVDAVLTPLAVLELNLGGAVGTGWDFPLMSLEGIKVGPANDDTTLVSDSLGGLYLKGRVGAALQFDTGAILEGEWKSILLRTYHELNLQSYTGAENTDWWNYESSGVKKNGAAYKGEYVVGYNMPLMVNTAAIMLEHTVDSVFDAVPSSTSLVLGLIANVKFFDGLNLTIIPQVNLEDGLEWKRLVAMLNYSL
jgi:hypothetical protein